MATDPSLFGISPEMYQQQLNTQDFAAANDFGKMDPMEAGRAGLFMAGRQVGRALGGEDPMVNILRQRQAVTQEIDSNDPQSFLKAAQKLYQAKDYQGAEHLVKTYRELDKTMAEAGEKRALTTKALRESLTAEQRNAAAQADLVGDRGTPEWQKAYSQELTRLTGSKEGPKVVGVTADGRLPVYQHGTQQFVYQAGPNGQQVAVPYNGAVDRSTSNIKVSASADKKEEDEYSKTAGKNYADLEKTAMETARSSAKAIRSLGTMESKANAGVYGGPQANMTKDAANFLESLGLLSAAQKDKLANSTEYDKNAKDLVMNDLGGKLGAQVSDADRKFVEDRIPQLTTSPKARMELIAKLRELHMKNIEYYRKMQSHLKENRTLKGFDFADADGLSTTSTPAAAPKAARSDEDLLKQYLGK